MRYVPCDPCDPVTISAKNRLRLQPVMMYGMFCVCAELRGSGKLAGDRGGNVEPRVAGQVRSGQVRYITRPKSETMRVTRQLGLPPRYRGV